MTEQPNELTEDLFPTTQYEAPGPTRRVFSPWHRPRKHFVRARQWSDLINELVDGRDTDVPLRYLGLPGSDFLDIRFFHDVVCGPAGRKLVFLGFDTSAEARNDVDTNTSLDEVRRLELVDKRSELLVDDLRTIAEPASMGYMSAARLGPFDVVNIDLCGSALAEGVGDEAQTHTFYDALSQMVGLQRAQSAPWLLFLTTRIGAPHINPTVVPGLADVLKHNLDECAEFASSCEDFLGAPPLEVLERLSEETAERCFRLMGTMLAKWLLALFDSGDCDMEFASSFSYSVNWGSGHPDMLSAVFRVKPRNSGVQDRAGLAQRPIRVPRDECAQAMALLRRLERTRDVDAILDDDPDLLEQITVESAALLAKARYDADAYFEWVAQDA